MYLETISKIGPRNPISLSIFDFEFIKNENIYGDLKSMNFNFEISEQLPF